MARPQRHFAVRTPGVPPQEPADDSQETNLDALAEDISDVALPPDEDDEVGRPIEGVDPASLPKTAPDLQAMIAEAVAKGVAKELAKQRKAQAGTVPNIERVPDQSEIDLRKVSGMVLTKQGYVIGTGMGAIPEHLQVKIAMERTAT